MMAIASSARSGCGGEASSTSGHRTPESEQGQAGPVGG